MIDLLAEIHPSWRMPLSEVSLEIQEMSSFLSQEVSQQRRYFPESHNIFRVFQSDFESVRVLIVGQDPYPTPGHAIGLAFAVSRQTFPIPRSLKNVYRELHSDLAIEMPSHGDLSAWNEQGVLLLNRVLTVAPGLPGSHRGKGWERITESAIRALARRDKPLVGILWGKEAQLAAPFLGQVPIIKSVHPSPLSANRGFFGSKPFSKTNELLMEIGSPPIDWRVSE